MFGRKRFQKEEIRLLQKKIDELNKKLDKKEDAFLFK